MTLPASGTISLSDVAAELGLSATGFNLNQSEARTLAGIPTGPISLSDFYGKSASHPVSQFSGSAQAFNVADPLCWLKVTFNTSGSVTVASYGSKVGSIGTNWYFPLTTGIGSSYYIRATLLSGNNFSGLADATWTSLATARYVQLSTGVYSEKACRILVEIAATPGGTVLASGTIDLTVASEP